MNITPASFDAPSRGVLIQWCKERIMSLRIQNDSRKLDVVETAMVRGQIAELKNLLGKIDPMIPGDVRKWPEGDE